MPSYCTEMLPFVPDFPMGGSTDVGNASYVVPTAQVLCTIVPFGTAAHSWQMTSCAGTTLGDKGALVAAQTIAATAVYALQHPELVQQANEELEKKTGKQLPKLAKR